MFREWLNFLLLPALDWIQVEVSSYCNAACLYCPRTVYRNNWQNRHMSLATFKRLLPAFAKTQLVYLQGWGEPFLNPDFLTMASLAKKRGCRIGVTTNGMLLTPEMMRRLVSGGLDIIAFSMAGIGKENDRIRRGTQLQKVLENIQTLQQIKAAMGQSQPAIHIAYMLLRSGLSDVEKLPLVLQDLGVNQVVITVLDFVPCPELAGEAIRPACEAEVQEIKTRLDAVRAAGQRNRVEIYSYVPGGAASRQTCTENVQQALFVSADGTVSPCTFTNLPVPGGSVHIYREESMPYYPLTFGNINDTSLTSIWRQPAYSAFRRSFYTGQPASMCQNCPKLFVIS